MQTIESLNQALFLRINAGPDTPGWMLRGAAWVADYFIYLVPVMLVVTWLWGGNQQRNLGLKACTVALLGVGVNQILGFWWPHPRPFMIGIGHSWIPHVADSSFPSDHMTVLSAVGLTFLLGGQFWLGLLTLAVGILVAWSRVFLGVHFPFDMLGAVAIALATLAFLSLWWRRSGLPVTECMQSLYRYFLAFPIKHGWLPR